MPKRPFNVYIEKRILHRPFAHTHTHTSFICTYLLSPFVFQGTPRIFPAHALLRHTHTHTLHGHWYILHAPPLPFNKKHTGHSANMCITTSCARYCMCECTRETFFSYRAVFFLPPFFLRLWACHVPYFRKPHYFPVPNQRGSELGRHVAVRHIWVPELVKVGAKALDRISPCDVGRLFLFGGIFRFRKHVAGERGFKCPRVAGESKVDERVSCIPPALHIWQEIEKIDVT